MTLAGIYCEDCGLDPVKYEDIISETDDQVEQRKALGSRVKWSILES